MFEPVAPTEIANLASDILKTENIEDIEMVDGDRIAEVMNRWWDVSKRACLEGFPWNFASTRDAIALASPAPTSGYDDKYLLPDDFVSLNWIIDEKLPLSQWDYTIEENYLLINNSGGESLNIGYVFNSDDIAKWTSRFKIYVAYQLAYFTAFKLTGQAVLAARIEGKLAPHRLEAKAVNGIMNPPKAFRESAMIRARKTFGRRTPRTYEI